ncbi:hypothetical protein T12_16252 [Trichinella patagoniensis]|uniref:Uncharacterized protein n=1 Tax=Trichinella patagoniensis TaxID=990121 RepID=A0A0V0Z8M2_9BILA|nr:hypothetical protein T12_16252 [Trichinella patagoniensis]
MKQINLITKFEKFTVNCKNSLDRSSGELIHSAARTNKTEIDVCRFLYKDHGVQEIPHVNRFKRLCFGLSCSPFLAMCVIRHHARKYQNKFPETVNEILENMLLQNGLVSINSGQRFAYNCLINGFLWLKLSNFDMLTQVNLLRIIFSKNSTPHFQEFVRLRCVHW